MARCYVRNGVWGWSIEAQLAALKAAGVLEPDKLYTDELTAVRAKRPGQVRPEWLEQRAVMLKPTGRRGGEVIHVANLLVLGVSEADLIDALAKAAARRATVQTHDTTLAILPGAGAQEIALALRDWTLAKREAQTRPGRRLGNASAAAAAKARTLAKLPAARPLWALPTEKISSVDIGKQVGLSVKTLYAYLGRREVAQYAAKRRAKRKGKTT